VTHASHLAIGYLPQELPKMSGATVLEETMRLGGRREDLLKAKEELEQDFASGVESAPALERYGRVMEELEHLDEYRLEARAKSILGGMGFKPSDFSRSLMEFSGGWLMRVALSRILLMDPDLLLLDEPTNHLDLESVLWLEDFLRKSKGALLMISHDLAFLNRVVEEVIEIDQRKMWSYKGNLDAFVVQKEERLKILRSQFAGQQAKVAEIEAFVERFGAKATKARQAQSRLKQLEKMELIELPEERSSVKFRFPPAPHSGKDVVRFENASLKFAEKTLFRDLNWLIRKGTRTAIVGVNGAGKTTLLKMLATVLPPTTGDVKLGTGVLVGYYSQIQAETLDLKKTILQELESVAPNMPMAQVRAIAGAFLFSGDAVGKKIAVLSGGEKARVALAKLLLSPVNFLILDEPTNHLDVESRGVLLDALQSFSGTLCLVSHDRDFVAPLVDTVLEIEPTGKGSQVHHLTSSYADYLERKMREIRDKTELSSQSGPEERPSVSVPQSSRAVSSGPSTSLNAEKVSVRKSVSNNQRKSWEREKDKLEAEIEKLESEKEKLALLTSDPAVYADKIKAFELIERQRTLESNLNESLSRWEELSLLLEN
jgi:ATP-binding cassette subfamily F protein 3